MKETENFIELYLVIFNVLFYLKLKKIRNFTFIIKFLIFSHFFPLIWRDKKWWAHINFSLLLLLLLLLLLFGFIFAHDKYTTTKC